MHRAATDHAALCGDGFSFGRVPDDQCASNEVDDLQKMETTNRGNLPDYPQEHDHPGQNAGQLPPVGTLHHRQGADQGAASNNSHENDTGKVLATEICVLNPGCLLGDDAGHESNAPWIQHTDFGSQYFPGVILMAIVGGSSLIGALAMMKGAYGWQLSSILAGVIMLLWIVGEIASIRGFHFLQVVYFVTGALVIWYTPKGKPVSA